MIRRQWLLPKIHGSWFFFGMLLLVGGILFVYFAYVAYPGYFLNFVFPGGPVDLGGVILMLLLPLIAVFAGGVLVYVSIRDEPVQQKETFRARASLLLNSDFNRFYSTTIVPSKHRGT